MKKCSQDAKFALFELMSLGLFFFKNVQKTRFQALKVNWKYLGLRFRWGKIFIILRKMQIFGIFVKISSVPDVRTSNIWTWNCSKCILHVIWHILITYLILIGCDAFSVWRSEYISLDFFDFCSKLSYFGNLSHIVHENAQRCSKILTL